MVKRRQDPAAKEPRLLKMSEFAAESGVPAPTIKHYLREGLLPEPVRTGRNMAYYDAALIPRVRQIKHLQKRLFLPLHVIKEVLEAGGDQISDADIALERSIAAVLKDGTDARALTRARAEAQGATAQELDLFEQLGLLKPIEFRGEPAYEGDDVVFGLMDPGEVFGELGLLTGGVRTATVTAVDSCELLVLDRRDFLPFLRSHPDAAINLLEALAERVRRISEFVEDTLSERALRSAGVFRPDAVRRMLDDHAARRRNYDNQIWALLVFTAWHAQMISSPAPPARARSWTLHS